MGMTCGLCKKPIRGDQDYVTDHYKCSADLHQSFHADIDKLLVALKCMVDSAVPNPMEHPTMTKAWKLANEVLSSVEGTR